MQRINDNRSSYPELLECCETLPCLLLLLWLLTKLCATVVQSPPTAESPCGTPISLTIVDKVQSMQSVDLCNRDSWMCPISKPPWILTDQLSSSPYWFSSVTFRSHDRWWKHLADHRREPRLSLLYKINYDEITVSVEILNISKPGWQLHAKYRYKYRVPWPWMETLSRA